MAFDLSTARPIESEAPPTTGFDLRTARPVVSEVPGPRRSWTDVATEAVVNLPSSAAKFAGGLYDVVTSPVETTKALGAVVAGGIGKIEEKVLPGAVRDFIKSFAASPDNYDKAIQAADAFGGFYKDRYGDIDKLKNTLATDPVGAAADLSTLLSGGATATGRLAPATSAVLATASRVVDPLTLPTKVAGAGVRGAATGAGNLIDLAQGQRADVRAGEIVRQAVTEEGRRPGAVAPVRATLTQAPPGVTGRQAAAPMMAPQLQALGMVMEERAPGIASITREAQEAGRRGTLQAVTPDEAAARAARTQATEPLYKQAAAVQVPLDPTMQALIDRMPSSVISAASELARTENRPFILQPSPIAGTSGAPAVTGETLHYIKRGLDGILSGASEKPLSVDMRRAVARLRDEYIKAIETRIPAYGQARTTFAQMSPEVNQAQVLNKLREVLEAPLGVGERATALGNVLVRGEQPLLKKATGQTRYTELSDVLSPQQMAAVSAVKGELTREADIAEQAVRGRKALDLIVEANTYGFRLPGLFSAKIQLANDTLALMQGKLNKDVMAALEKGFQSGKSLDELIGKVPAKDRIAVLRALGEASTKLSSAKPTAAAQFEASQRERRNALSSAPTNKLID